MGSDFETDSARLQELRAAVDVMQEFLTSLVLGRESNARDIIVEMARKLLAERDIEAHAWWVCICGTQNQSGLCCAQCDRPRGAVDPAPCRFCGRPTRESPDLFATSAPPTPALALSRTLDCIITEMEQTGKSLTVARAELAELEGLKQGALIRLANNIAGAIHREWAQLSALHPSALSLALYTLAVSTVCPTAPMVITEQDDIP